MHKCELIFGQHTISTTEKSNCKHIMRCMNASCLFSQNYILNFGSLNCTGRWSYSKFPLPTQQNPSSDTPTSGTHPPHFFTWYVSWLLNKKKKTTRKVVSECQFKLPLQMINFLLFFNFEKHQIWKTTLIIVLWSWLKRNMVDKWTTN